MRHSTLPSLLDRIQEAGGIASSRQEWEVLMDEVHPARDLFARHPVYRALDKYTFNEVAPVYLPLTQPEMRDHFLPHLGLLIHREFKDPRVASQYAIHQMLHCFIGWPLPVGDFESYYRACAIGEVLAALDTEYALFERLPEETRGMFDPSYPSLHDAFHAVGVVTHEEAIQESLLMQFGTFSDRIKGHPAFRAGVAHTLLRQAAWAVHDQKWAEVNWQYQVSYQRLWHDLYTPNQHRTIFQRQEDYVAHLIRYDQEHDYDEGKHRAKTVLNLQRISAALRNDATLHGSTVEDVLQFHREQSLYDDPMPFWPIAVQFHEFRLEWERTLLKSVGS